MLDPEIERKIEEVKQLIQIWHQFYNILIAVFGHTDDIVKLDAEFQKIKTTIAQKHPILMSVVIKDDYIAQTVLATVRRTISLQEFRTLSSLEINKVIIEWHEANILLNETLGYLEYQRDSLVGQSAAGKATQEGLSALRDQLGKLWANAYVKLALRMAITVVIIGVVYLYRHEIAANPYYIKYLKTSVDWIGETLGISGLLK